MKTKLPPFTKLGKIKTNGLQIGGRAVFASCAQIYVECNGRKKGCKHSLSIIPTASNANEILDSISDEEAAKIFISEGWTVKGFNSKKNKMPRM